MDATTAVIVILAINFGFVLGAWWVSSRRENWLRQHQPLDSAWGDTEYYDRLTARYRAEGVL